MTLLIVLVVLVACAVLGAWLFKNNSRPAWLGALLGFLFGIPGLIVMLIVFQTQRKRGTTATA